MKRAAILALCVALAACATPQVLAPGSGPTQVRFADSGHWIAADGYTLAFSNWQAKKPVAIVVALHGMGDYGEAFKLPAAWWAERGIATYAYDQRGFGRTEGNARWPGHDIMAADARAFVALVRAKHPGLPVYLLGESMGGAVAIVAATQDGPPVADGIVLVSPALQGWSNLALAERTALWTFMQVSPGSQLTGQGLGVVPSDNRPILEAMGRDPYTIKRTRVDALYGLVDLMEAAWQAAPRVALPTLVVYAGHDQIVAVNPIDVAVGEMHGPVSAVCYGEGFHMLLRDLKGEAAWDQIRRFVATPASKRPPAEIKRCA